MLNICLLLTVLIETIGIQGVSPGLVVMEGALEFERSEF